MQATFLGHQTWLISHKGTNILIDPVLYDNFGSNDDSAIEIYPPRHIDFANMPPIEAIILSHEHSDHFHIPTLLKFKHATVITSEVMVECISDIILEHGMQTKRIAFFESTNIGALTFTFYPADLATVFWESRVSQICIHPTENEEESIFIAVDALVSERYVNLINDEIIPCPKAIVVSNNSQLTPKNVLGSLDNYKDVKLANRKEIPGISILKDLLIGYLEGLERIENIIICGGGFTKKYDTHFGSFPLSDQNVLAEIANVFSLDKHVFGPLPGQRINFSGEIVEYIEPVSWVKLNTQRLNEIHMFGEKFNNNPVKIDIKPLLLTNIKYDPELLDEALIKLARAFMLSALGQTAIEYISAHTTAIPPYGLALKLFMNSEFSQVKYLVLNFGTAQFDLVAAAEVDEANIPFGLELFFNDFIALISGDIQIWDLAGISVKSWFIGEKMDSPVGFLYSYFGEQVNPELNAISLRKRWSESVLNVDICVE